MFAGTSAGAAQQTYSLLQMSAVTGAASRIQSRADLPEAVVNMAKRLAREHQSTALAELASRIAAVLRYGSAAGADPFSKGKDACIRTYCTVGGETSADATEKAYCNKEIAKTAQLESDISKLTTKVDQAAAAAKLKADVKEL